jgi:hypothetical protein
VSFVTRCGSVGNDVGMWFCGLPGEDPSKALKLTRIIENTAGKIIGVMPKSTGFAYNRVQIRTQCAGSSNTFLKAPRIITSNFILEEN